MGAKATFYLPTFLKDDKYPSSSGVCTLLVRTFTLRLGAKGRLTLKIDRDALDFSDEPEMLDAVEGMEELPVEAETDPQYIPEDFRPENVNERLGPRGAAGATCSVRHSRTRSARDERECSQ